MDHAAVDPDAADATGEAAARRSRVANATRPSTLLDLLEGAFARFADQPAVAMWHDDGKTTAWSYRELDRRSRLAAWRLREELGLAAWRPGPDVEPVRPGAAGRLLRGDAGGADPRAARPPDEPGCDRGDHRPGRAAPAAPRHRPGRAGSRGRAGSPRSRRRRSRASWPSRRRAAAATRWSGDRDAWPRPRPEDIWDLIFTSGTTGTPKGVMVAHDNLLATMEAIGHVIPPLEHRIISVLPLSHLFEQAIGLIYALSVGADILYVRSRNPRVLFDRPPGASGHEHDRRPAGARPLLERHRARGRPDRPAGDLRPPPRRSPGTSRTRSVACSSGASTLASVAASGCSSAPARSCRRPSSRPGRTSASR